MIDAFSAVRAAAAYDPLEPGPLAAALLEDESRVMAGGSATASPSGLVLIGLVGLFCRRLRRRQPQKPLVT